MTDEWEDGPPPLQPGASLAPGYVVVTHMRRGEDLDVYDIWSEERWCRCIGKTPRPDRLDESDATARLLREGHLLLKLTHPNIVRAYEVCPGPRPLVILETLPGETLAYLIERQPDGLTARQVAQLGVHLCSAIGYLHRQDVLHLDIKPSNIVVSHGLAKVLDLSLARGPGHYKGGTGTDGYMSPEQVEGGDYGPQTDVWGLGATLFEAATGEAACDDGEHDSAASDSDISQEVCRPPPVRGVRRVALPLAALIDRSLNQNPSDRPTVADLASGLEAFVLAGRGR